MAQKIRNWFLICLICIPTVFFSLVFVRMLNPYMYVLGNTDNQLDQISLYNKILPKDKFNDLLNKLIQSNDVRTIHSVAFYCRDNLLCNQIEILEQKANEFYEIPKDSIWTIEINSSYSRKSSRKMLDFSNNLLGNLTLLKKKCN